MDRPLNFELIDYDTIIDIIINKPTEYPGIVYELCTDPANKEIKNLCNKVDLNDIKKYWFSKFKDYDMFGVDLYYLYEKPKAFSNLSWKEIYELFVSPGTAIMTKDFLKRFVKEGGDLIITRLFGWDIEDEMIDDYLDCFDDDKCLNKFVDEHLGAIIKKGFQDDYIINYSWNPKITRKGNLFIIKSSPEDIELLRSGLE